MLWMLITLHWKFHRIMSDEELDKVMKEMVLEFGDRLPDPECEPIRFAYYVKLFKYLRSLNEPR